MLVLYTAAPARAADDDEACRANARQHRVVGERPPRIPDPEWGTAFFPWVFQAFPPPQAPAARVRNQRRSLRVARRASRPDAPHVTFFPVLGSSPLTGFLFGAVGNIAANHGPRHTTTDSVYSILATASTRGFVYVELRDTVFLHDDDWTMRGRVGFHRESIPFYGLGGRTPDTGRDDLVRLSVLVEQLFLRRIWSRLYAGVGYRFDEVLQQRSLAVEDGATDAPSQTYPHGTGQRYRNSGLEFALVWDSRDDVNTPTRGLLAQAVYRLHGTWLGSTTGWHEWRNELRGYHRLTPRPFLVMSWRAMHWSTAGDVPMIELPAVGADVEGTTGRGYVPHRYAGRHLLYGELAFRWTLVEWLGLVSFVNVHSVTEANDRFRYVSPAGGFGLRFLMHQEAGVNLGLDWAVGIDGKPRFYMRIAEAF